MEFLLDASFYLMGALLIMPFVIALGTLVRLWNCGLPEALMLLPSAILAAIVADMFFLGGPGCLSFWNVACQAIGIVGWIFYLPALMGITALNGSALAALIARNTGCK